MHDEKKPFPDTYWLAAIFQGLRQTHKYSNPLQIIITLL